MHVGSVQLRVQLIRIRIVDNFKRVIAERRHMRRKIGGNYTFFFRFPWDNCSSWLKYYGSQSETETRHVYTESCVKQMKGALRIYSVNMGMKTFCTGYIIMLSFFLIEVWLCIEYLVISLFEASSFALYFL